MSKRKRAPRPEPDESTDEAGVKDDMVHVTPDLLAGSPDIFAGKKVHAAVTSGADAMASPVQDAELREDVVAPTEASTTLAAPDVPEAADAGVDSTHAADETAPRPVAAGAEPVAAAPAYVNMPPPPARARRAGSSMAIGIVLVVIGIFALGVVLSGIDLTESGWPLFILIPGLTLIVAGFVSLGAVATIPGGVLTMLGLGLAYSSAYERWTIWFYTWALVVPFGVGLGLYLQALRERDLHDLRTGRTLMAVGFMIFLIGFVLFESILGISGREAFGPLGKAALPLLLIIVGIILLVRSVQRSRQI